MTLTGPVCDAGRCSQVLAAFAVVRDRATERLAGELEAALERVVERLGHDPKDPLVRAVLAEELAALVAGPKTIEGVAA
jgi:hypothetical protein